ncbi:MAG TPA: stage V sporulation protein AE [Bacillales bacterium]|nr:stage V sporulation protein AE [Bacillales bacterium]
MEKKNVILITDGDQYAYEAVNHVAEQIGGCCISQSSGNPTALTGEEIVDFIMKTPCDLVLVMADDCGYRGEGPGEKAIRYIAEYPDIQVLGAVAVASNTDFREWTRVDVSVERSGELSEFGVDKNGVADLELGRMDGDTVYVLDDLDLPVVVGVGDIGKMDGQDTLEKGCPITKKAIEIVLERSGYKRA